MTMTETVEALRGILQRHAQPDPAVVTQVKKGGDLLDAVGHAEVTRILLEEDPLWKWEPQAWAPTGGPVITREVRYQPVKRDQDPLSKPVEVATMWGWLTVHGRTVPCVGTCEVVGHPELDKELIGDLLRNGAIRFGIALNLWSKAEKATEDYQPPAVEPERQWADGGEDRWKGLADRLRALPQAVRDRVIEALASNDLFDGRRPVTPFLAGELDAIEGLIAAGERPVEPGEWDSNGRPLRSAPEGPAPVDDGPSLAAIEVVAAALSIKDPLNPPEGYTVEPWMWELAEVTDLDAHDWKVTATAAHMRQKDILDRAKKIAEEAELPEPDRLTDIHGLLADELRAVLISDPSPF